MGLIIRSWRRRLGVRAWCHDGTVSITAHGQCDSNGMMAITSRDFSEQSREMMRILGTLDGSRPRTRQQKSSERDLEARTCSRATRGRHGGVDGRRLPGRSSSPITYGARLLGGHGGVAPHGQAVSTVIQLEGNPSSFLRAEAHRPPWRGRSGLLRRVSSAAGRPGRRNRHAT